MIREEFKIFLVGKTIDFVRLVREDSENTYLDTIYFTDGTAIELCSDYIDSLNAKVRAIYDKDGRSLLIDEDVGWVLESY